MKSTTDEIAKGSPTRASHQPPGPLVIVIPALLGALVATVLGLLTFGVQATAEPHHLPLGIGPADASAAPAMEQVTRAVAAQGGDLVDWRAVGSGADAERLLDNKQIYGALLLKPGSTGLTASVLLSGAVNPGAAQAAQPILNQVAQQITAAGGAPAVQLAIVHPTSAAGRTLPLAASALLWLATLVASVFVVAALPRLHAGLPVGRAAAIGAGATAAIFGAAVVLGLAWIWDSTLPLSWAFVGMLLLVGLAFALLQGGVLRWLGLPGIALLAPLYLMAPAVAALPAELLNPIYRTLLWSWTPFRFSSEGFRSLLFIGSGAADVRTAVLVFGGIALAGLLLMAAPRPRPR
jgi:hypothetical protein